MPTCPYVNQVGVRCGSPEGHAWGHGNGLLTTPRDEWHLPAPPPILNEADLSPLSALDAARLRADALKKWELHDGEQQCLWQGAHSRCMLRLGHFPQVGHKELDH